MLIGVLRIQTFGLRSRDEPIIGRNKRQ